MKELYTQIEIEGSLERVWQVLTDFDRFSEWNRFIPSVTGELTVGSQLKVIIQSPGFPQRMFRPRVVKVEVNREFRWRGSLLIPSLIDGEHIFAIESIAENQVRFRHSEQFHGILVPLLWKILDTSARQGFNEMNAALKQLVESTEF